MEEFPRHGAADVSELQKCIVSLIIGSSRSTPATNGIPSSMMKWRNQISIFKALRYIFDKWTALERECFQGAQCNKDSTQRYKAR